MSKLLSAFVLVILGLFTTATAQPTSENPFHVLPVQGNVYMLVGPQVNSTLQIGQDGILVVDTQLAQLSEQMIEAIQQLSDLPIRYILNTHAHPDHTGGNEAISLAGQTIAGGNVSRDITNASEGATIIAHENTVFNMLKQDPPPSGAALPKNTYFTDQKDLYFNGEAVLLIHAPQAHTNGDSIIHFRGSDVISTGDLFVTTSYPFIDEANGGNIEGILGALNQIIKIAVPADKQEGGTMIIPGHGRLCDEADVVEYRDMLTIIRDRIKAMIEDGQSLRQVKAAKPSRDYDARFGADSGFWTTEQFVEAIYRNLSL